MFRLISHHRIRSIFGVGLIAGAALVVGISTNVLAQQPPTPTPQQPVTSTPAVQLPAPSIKDVVDGLEGNVVLNPPVGASSISQTAAEQTALGRYRGSSVLEVGLYLVKLTYPSGERLAWVVSLVPPPGYKPHSAGPGIPGTPIVQSPVRYLVVIIDAKTGETLLAISGN